MSRLIHQPHDKLFKQALSDIRVAKDFFKTHLPANVLQQIDLATLQLQQQSFIDEAYKTTEADVLYQVQLNNCSAFLYVLCEHQSNIDSMISFRLLTYSIRIMDLHLKQHQTKELPLVYPLLIYTGDKLWNVSLDWFDLFGEQSGLARQVFFQPSQLIDVQRINDEDLRKHVWAGLVEFALKYREIRNFQEFLDILLPWLEEVRFQGGVNYSKHVLYYVVDGIEAEDKRFFIEKSKQYLSEELRGEAMTLAQQFVQEGITKGLEQGIQEGMQQGMQQGMRLAMEQITQKLLSNGMSIEAVSNLTGLTVAELRQFQTSDI